MSYSTPLDPAAPNGATTPANQIDEEIRKVKAALIERLDDITGADWEEDDPIDLKAYGPSVKLESKQVGQDAEHNNGNSGSTFTINWNNGNYQRLALNANCTLTLDNPIVATYVLRVVNTGSFTLTWPSTAKFPGNAVFQPTANRDSVFTLYWNGSYYNVGVLGGNYQP